MLPELRSLPPLERPPSAALTPGRSPSSRRAAGIRHAAASPQLRVLLCAAVAAAASCQGASGGDVRVERSLADESNSSSEENASAPVSYRTNLCDAAESITNGDMSMRSALQGRHLTFATGTWSEKFLTKRKDTGEWVGYEYDLLKQLAKRGGFTFRLLEHNWSETGWTEDLKSALPQYDMVTNAYWVITVERAMQGAFSPYGFLDTSYVFVALSGGGTTDAIDSVLQFLAPFTPAVWGFLCCMIVSTGLVYYIIESGRMDPTAQNHHEFPAERHSALHLGQSMFLSTMQVSQNGGFSPKTAAGKIVLASWAICLLIIIEAYTANLTTFLVAKQATKKPFSSLHEAMTQEAPICLLEGTAMLDWFLKQHPTYDHIVRVNGTEGADMLALRQGKCSGAVVTRLAFDIHENSKLVNNDCTLDTIGLPMHAAFGGFMTYSDYSDKCTNVLKYTLNLLFLELKADGALDALYDGLVKSYWSRASPQSCGASPKDAEAEDLDSLRLHVMHVSGIFSIHGGAMLIAVIMTLSKVGASRSRSGIKWLSSTSEESAAAASSLASVPAAGDQVRLDVAESEAAAAEDASMPPPAPAATPPPALLRPLPPPGAAREKGLEAGPLEEVSPQALRGLGESRALGGTARAPAEPGGGHGPKRSSSGGSTDGAPRTKQLASIASKLHSI